MSLIWSKWQPKWETQLRGWIWTNNNTNQQLYTDKFGQANFIERLHKLANASIKCPANWWQNKITNSRECLAEQWCSTVRENENYISIYCILIFSMVSFVAKVRAFFHTLLMRLCEKKWTIKNTRMRMRIAWFTFSTLFHVICLYHLKIDVFNFD